MFVQIFLHKILEKLTISLMRWSMRREKSLEEVLSEREYAFNENSVRQVLKSGFLLVIFFQIDYRTPSLQVDF
jgi:hypothetical protein